MLASGSHLRNRVLDKKADQQLGAGRALLGELREQLVGIPATPDDSAALAASIQRLDDFFLLVVVGEFNAGKSAFVNALLGTQVLEEGVTPTTSQILLVRYGPDSSAEDASSGVHTVTAPVDLLKDVHIVDTPGTNAIVREHERLTTDYVPRSDLVLFVTSADRPFSESERTFLSSIREWGKKIVLVLNKIDIFAQPSELEQVLAFVREAAQRHLGMVPDIFPVSARLAWKAKAGDQASWEPSRFAALERYLEGTLDEKSRFKLKLLNPLGVGDALARRYVTLAGERLALIAGDLATLEDIERQLEVYREDLARGFELRLTAVEKVLMELEARGHQYFEDTLRIGRVFDLLNRSRVQREFEEKVVADAPQQVERRVAELIDWLVDQDFRQWQAITARLAPRQQAHGERILGSPEIGSFHADRSRLLDSVGREAQRVVETYDRRRESQEIADGARNAVAATAAVGAGALGLGAAVTAAATTAAADVTGVLITGVLATVGFLIIPTKRRRARAEMRRKVTALRERLMTAMRAEFDRARERSALRLVDAMAPYTRFIRAEETRWKDVQASLGNLRERVAGLIAEVER